ncbi:MAG: endonuclease/exonuclease/phosphatase family protein [Cyanobacteria bacterium P01_A01_bin.84]
MGFPTFISRIIWIYIIFFCLWLILRIIFFDSLWWLALINTAALYLFVPLIIFIPFSLLRRQWRLFVGLCFPLGVFLVFWGSLFLPKFTPHIHDNNHTIKVMTFNVLFNNEDYNTITKMVTKNSPDIIGFQEIFPTKSPKFKKLFASKYPYQVFYPFKDYYTHNVALLSRFPISNVTILPVKELERGLLVTLDLNNQKQIQVIVTHLIPSYPLDQFLKLSKKWYSRRLEQVSYLQKIIINRKLPIILMCDCNFTDTSETYSQMHKVMKDSFNRAGWGFGHSFKGSLFPIGRIDYIWYTKELQAVNAYVAEDAGSDHLPVIAQLNLPY